MTRTALLITLAHLPAAPFAQSFQGLGDLPGGSFYSQAFGVSADGSVVVGGGNSALGAEAFRWTEAGGMVGLGDLPGDDVDSRASAASADGSVVVGEGKSAEGREAFRWTAAGGMVGLGDVPGGSFSSHAHGVSADGSVVVGEGSVQAFRWTLGGGMQGLGWLPGGDYSAGYGVSADGNVVVGQASVPGDGWEAFRWTAAGGMAGLGVLPGADVHQSTAYAASADGSVIVGVSRVAGAYEAFRWTAAGMEGLGDLPGGPFNSTARGVSADGTVIVGEGSAVGGGGAFVWTPAEGMRSLREILVAAGVNLDGWVLTFANAVSADGTVIVGSGRNPQGQTEAWRAELPSLRLITPAAGSLLVGGENVRIRWAAPASVDLVALTLLPDTLGGAPVTIDFGLAAADTAYVWAVPDTLFSRSARIAIEDMEAPALADTSGAFRVKPYHLTRLSAGGARYEPFRPDRHGWPFGNTQAALFPPQWYGLNSFDYAGGLDPFTDDEYDDDFPAPPINGVPSVFPDWPAYVRAFGTDAAYHVVVPGVEAWYRDAFTAAWGAAHGGDVWGGSCFGMAASSLLAFTHREAFGQRYPGVGPVEQLHTVPMSVPVRELVNELYAHQSGRVNVQATEASLPVTTPRDVLADLKTLFGGDGPPGLLRNLTLYGVTSCAPRLRASGAHTVTPYRLERVAGAVGRWRVYIYDSNRPADTTAVVLVDSTANQWAYAGGLNWGGACALILEDPIENYLQLAIPMSAAGGLPQRRRGGADTLYVAAASGTVRLASAAGAVGHEGGAVFNTLDGALPRTPKVGGSAAPVGYAVPPGAYTLTLADAPDARLSAYVSAPEAVYAYGRADAEAAHTDRLAYDPDGGLGGALTAASDDAGATKVVTLRAVVPGDPERTLDAASIPLTGPDSVRFAALDHADGPRLRLDNEGGAKTYTLRLRQADASGGARFRHAAVPLAAGATHTVRPDWAALGDGPVEVDVDLDGDGSPDEVLVLANQVSSAPGAPAGLPQAFALHAPYPNPFAGRTTLPYDMPATGRVRVALYDLLGREVARLVDAEVVAGRHEAVLDAPGLAAGVYLVRMTTAGFAKTQRLTLLR